MTTLEEHRAKIEEMKAAEKRLRAIVVGDSGDRPYVEDIALLLERIDAYEASIAWHTDCLSCPKLLDKNHQYHELLRRSLDFQRSLIEKRRDQKLIEDIVKALE